MIERPGNLNVVIDPPKGCRHKYAFDFDVNGYVLKTVMPKGLLFPFDFGFGKRRRRWKSKHWYEYLLHNQRAALLKVRLFLGGDERVIVINTPWYLRKEAVRGWAPR